MLKQSPLLYFLFWNVYFLILWYLLHVIKPKYGQITRARNQQNDFALPFLYSILIISTKEAVIITLSLWLINSEINRSAMFTSAELWDLNILPPHCKYCFPD